MNADTWTAVFTGAEAVFTAAIFVTGIVALKYAKRQLAENRESDKVQHLVRFIERFEDQPMASCRKAVAEKKIKGTSYPPEAENILNFFETIGLLVRRGYLDISDVWNSFGYWMFNVYADFREEIEQEQRADRSYYEDFCTLIDGLRKIEVEKGGSDDHPSKEEIQDFWREESKTIPGAPVRRRKGRKPRVRAEGAPQQNQQPQGGPA